MDIHDNHDNTYEEDDELDDKLGDEKDDEGVQNAIKDIIIEENEGEIDNDDEDDIDQIEKEMGIEKENHISEDQRKGYGETVESFARKLRSNVLKPDDIKRNAIKKEEAESSKQKIFNENEDYVIEKKDQPNDSAENSNDEDDNTLDEDDLFSDGSVNYYVTNHLDGDVNDEKIAEDDTVNDVNEEYESEDDEIEGNKFNDPWGRRGKTDFAFLIAMIDCDCLLPVYFFF